MALLHLRGRKNCERVKTKGLLWKGKHMQARYMLAAPRTGGAKNIPNGLYVGSVASTKLDKSSVKRNRMRRRTREALRTSEKALKTTLNAPVQLLLLPRSSSLTCDFAELQQDASALLSALAYGSRPR